MDSVRPNSLNLDMLRTFAVMLVFAAHLANALGWNTKPIDGIGRVGVLIFFVHTSFVLMGSMERLASGGSNWIARFYVQRAMRIYPLAILTVLAILTFSIPPWGGNSKFVWPTNSAILANLLLVQNIFRIPPLIAPLWTLPIELQMYAVLPPIFLVTGDRSRWLFRFVLILACSIAMAFVVNMLTGHMNIFAFTPCFLSGILAYRLRHRLAPTFPVGLCAAWVILLSACFAALYDPHNWKLVVPMGWVFCLALAILPVFQELQYGKLAKSFQFIAKYSYGIYLGHSFGLWLSFRVLGLNGPGAALASIFFTLVLSVAAYHAVEEPFIRLSKRFLLPHRHSSRLPVAA